MRESTIYAGLTQEFEHFLNSLAGLFEFLFGLPLVLGVIIFFAVVATFLQIMCNHELEGAEGETDTVTACLVKKTERIRKWNATKRKRRMTAGKITSLRH